MSEGLVIAIIGVLSSLAGIALGGYLVQQRTAAEAEKYEAEANEIIKNTVLGLLEPLNCKIKSLQAEVTQLRREVDKLGRRNKSLWGYVKSLLEVIQKLMTQIREAGLVPCAEPPEWEETEEASNA